MTRLTAPSPASQDRSWSLGLLVLCVLGLAGLAWATGGFVPRHAPSAEIEDIFEKALSTGTYAYDPTSGADNMRPREMIQGAYVASTRAPNGRPVSLAFFPSEETCTSFVRDLAEIRGELGFCEPTYR